MGRSSSAFLSETYCNNIKPIILLTLFIIVHISKHILDTLMRHTHYLEIHVGKLKILYLVKLLKRIITYVYPIQYYKLI